MIQNNVRGVALHYKSVAKEILKPPYFGSLTPVGIKVYQFSLIYVQTTIIFCISRDTNIYTFIKRI